MVTFSHIFVIFSLEKIKFSQKFLKGTKQKTSTGDIFGTMSIVHGLQAAEIEPGFLATLCLTLYHGPTLTNYKVNMTVNTALSEQKC